MNFINKKIKNKLRIIYSIYTISKIIYNISRDLIIKKYKNLKNLIYIDE